jgi:uncharacterized membrane protein
VSILSRRFAERFANAFGAGRAIFAFAIVALGIENVVCARHFAFLYYRSPHPWFTAFPNFPYLPAIPAVAYIFGIVVAACGVGLLVKRALVSAAMSVGGLFFLCTLVLEAPKYAVIPGSMVLRTRLFEPLAIATLACLLPGREAIPPALEHASRYLLALSLVVFGVDHFLALAPIGTLIPNWIPWHVFWIAFFGAAFIAAGASIGFDVLLRWGAAGLGLMFAIWVFTLHLPRTLLGLYGGHPRNPEEWASLFIAIALWGGPWALADATGEHIQER